MLRSILSIVAGITVGILSIFIIEMINLSLYPVPADVNVMDPEPMRAYFSGLSVSSYVLIIVAHFVGVFLAGFIAGMVSRSNRQRVGLIAAVILVLYIAYNAFTFGLPASISVLDIVLSITGGILGARVGASRVVG